MAFSIQNGVWTTMITPFTKNNKVDFQAVKKLCDWYIQKGCSGIFAVCQSSEMAYLTKQEKIDLAKAVVDAVEGRVQVIASGHTASDQKTQFEELEAMMKTGVEAYVLVSNRLDQTGDDEEAFVKNANELFDRYPQIDFGIYECPIPFKRLVSLEFLSNAAQSGRMVFLKDTCCNYELIRKRMDAIQGSSLKLFNANAASYFDSIMHGAAGYNGIMANFHPDLYRWVLDHKDSDYEKAKLLSDFLTTPQ